MVRHADAEVTAMKKNVYYIIHSPLEVEGVQHKGPHGEALGPVRSKGIEREMCEPA